MVMIIVLVGILLAAFGVSAWMWIRIQQEAGAAESAAAVPVADIRMIQPLPAVAAPDYQKELEDQRVVYEDRLRELREELEASRARVQESERSSAGLTASLRDENEALRIKIEGLEASSAAADQSAAKIDHLIVENSAFRAQIVEASSEISRLKELVVRLEKQAEESRASGAEAADVQQRVDQAKEEYQRQLENVYKQVEELRAENARLQEQAAGAGQIDGLKRAADEFAGRVRELEAFNALQAEKNEYLQYELTKSRAQVVSLERVCGSLTSAAEK